MGQSALIDVRFGRRSKAFKRHPFGHWLRQKWGFIMRGLSESKCGLNVSMLWFSGYCAHTNVEFILNPFRSHTFFFSTFLPWQFGFLHSRESCFYDSLPVPLSSPPSRSLQPRGGQLASPSGCLFSGSEGSSKCALTPRLSPLHPASQVTHASHLPSATLLLSDRSSRRPDNKSRRSPIRSPPPSHSPSDSSSAICWYTVVTDAQTEISAGV